MSFVMEAFFSGCMSKVINDGADYSWSKIKLAVKDKSNQNVSAKIYRVIESALHIVTDKNIRDTDKLYDAIERIFIEFRENGDTIQSVKCGLDILCTDVSMERCEIFLEKFYEGICQDEDLYKRIILMLNQKGIKINQEEFRQLNEKMERNHKELRKKMDRMAVTLSGSNSIFEESIAKENLKFPNNKKQEYIKIWNRRLFLHIDSDERPITLADAFIMPDYILFKKVEKKVFSKDDTLDKIIEKFFSQNNTSTMLITGVPGIGKSSVTSWIANKYRDDETLIILRFRDWERENLEKGLLKAVCDTLGCRKKELNDKILILDGFDEMKSLDIREKILAAFFNDILDIKNLKCIITSRPEYVKTFHFQYVIHLKAFDSRRVRIFCKKIKNIDLEEKDIASTNLEVLGVPVILYMAIMSNIDIIRKATKPELYNRIFAEKGGIFDRFSYEGVGYDEGAHPFRNSDNIKKFLEFLQEVAFKMYKKNDLSLSVEKSQIPELEFQGKTIKILEFPIKHLFEKADSNIEFIHKSIYEYFVAEYLLTRINKCIRKENAQDLAGVLGKVLMHNVLSNEIAEYLSYKVLWKNYTSLEFSDITKLLPSKSKSLLADAFSIMLKNGMLYYSKERCKNGIECELNVFCSMMRILENCYNSKDKLSIEDKDKFLSYLSYQHLRSGEVHVLYIDLSGAEFVGVNLEKAEFINVNLEGTKFRDSKLKNARFMESNISSEFVNADLEGAEFRKSNIYSLDLSYSNLKGIELFKNLSPNVDSIIFRNAIVDTKTLLMLEDVFGNSVHNCQIDLCDNILSYEEYLIFREQKLEELQNEILELIETGKNYTEYKD